MTAITTAKHRSEAFNACLVSFFQSRNISQKFDFIATLMRTLMEILPKISKHSIRLYKEGLPYNFTLSFSQCGVKRGPLSASCPQNRDFFFILWWNMWKFFGSSSTFCYCRIITGTYYEFLLLISKQFSANRKSNESFLRKKKKIIISFLWTWLKQIFDKSLERILWERIRETRKIIGGEKLKENQWKWIKCGAERKCNYRVREKKK